MSRDSSVKFGPILRHAAPCKRMILSATMARVYEEIRSTSRVCWGTVARPRVPRILSKLEAPLSLREDLKARWPKRDAEEFAVPSTAPLDPRFVKDCEEGWSFSQAQARWKSRQRAARFGAALQTADTLVRKDRALQIFRLDDERPRVKTCEDVGSDIEEDAQNDLRDSARKKADEDVGCLRVP